jgi:hypothetical protein
MTTLLLVLACSDGGLKVYNSAPEVTLTTPATGQSLPEGEAITFTALVQDAQEPNETLTYTWTSTLVGTLEGTQRVTDAGVSLVVEGLAAGDHSVVLQVTDAAGATGTANTTFEVVPNEAPLVRFVSPGAGARVAAGGQMHLVVEVEDDVLDDLSAITLAWDGIPGADTLPTSPSADGSVDTYLSFADLGLYTLNVTATDPLGASTTDTVSFEVSVPDLDRDGYIDVELGGNDCNDGDSAVNPAAIERCDGIDNDCDGEADNAEAVDARTWYPDADADGFGDRTAPELACDRPTGFLVDGTDCDDTRVNVYPGALEYCDTVDNDCDGATDENNAVDVLTWYRDRDGDGHGRSDETFIACSDPGGYVTSYDDCDDGNASVSPSASEYCNDRDDDCDGSTDEDDAVDVRTWYRDADWDGWGTSSVTDIDCEQPSGYVATSTDCDDTTSGTSPGSLEYCDGVDNDCDGATDDDAVNGTTYYADTDGDGLGSASAAYVACSPTAGYVSNTSDCDDTDATVLDASTRRWYRDMDGDGYGISWWWTNGCTAPSGYVADATDCNDYDAGVYPGATETYYDGVDADCAGDSDYDADGDGWVGVDYPGGLDCDDSDATRVPGSETWTVPGDAATIQGAVDLACAYDTIEVSAGTYVENVDATGKPVSIVGIDGPSLTVLDGDFNGDPALTLPGGSLEGFTVTGGLANYGGGLYVMGSTSYDLAITDCVFEDNLAITSGGGALIQSLGSLTITDTAFSDNLAGTQGGGLYVSGVTDAVFDGVSAVANTVTGSGNGGGALISVTNATVRDSSFDFNSGSYVNGAGLYLAANTAEFDGVSISGNTSYGYYGGAYLSVTNIEGSDLDISDNSGSYAVYLYGGGGGTLEGLRLAGNASSGNSVIYLQGNMTLADFEMTDNVASGYHVAYVNGQVTLDGATIRGNTAGSSYATINGSVDGTWRNVAVYGNRTAGLTLAPTSSSGTLALENVSIVGNLGTGLTVTPSWVRQVTLRNVVIAHNGQQGLYNASSIFTADVRYCDVYGNAASAYSGLSDPTGTYGNVAVDPAFVTFSENGDPRRWDLHLAPGSALVDVGDPSITDDDGSRSDMGAFGGAGGTASYTADTDSDGMYDGWETSNGLTVGTDDSALDPDGDGLTNREEQDAGSDPHDDNSDHDLVTDGDEVAAGTDPTATETAASYEIGSTSFGAGDYLFLGDNNGDGRTDIYTGNTYWKWVVPGFVTGSSTSYMPSTVFGTSSYSGGLVGDFDGDGDEDMGFGYMYNYSSRGSVALFTSPRSGMYTYATYEVIGSDPSDYFGYAVAGGDVDGDGLAELIVGATGDDDAGTDAGAAYVVDGPFSGSATVSASTAKVTGDTPSMAAGTWVGVMDVNADGTDDLLVSEMRSTGYYNGSIGVFFGPVSGRSGIGSADVTIDGSAAYAYFGQRFVNAGDTNGDGYDDLAGWASSARAYAGAVYVFRGPLTADTATAYADASILGSGASDYLGQSMSTAGDMNGDGIAEFAVGARYADTTASDAGALYLFAGPLTGALTPEDAEVHLYGDDTSYYMGTAVAGGRDLTGDGVSDVVTVASGVSYGNGRLYLLEGGW